MASQDSQIAINLINQCAYGEHKLNGKWEWGGETYTLTSGFIDTTPPPLGCDVNKYCAYTYNNDNCQINTWTGGGKVPVVYECTGDGRCGNGAQCVHNLCCHTDKLAFGSSQCPTLNDLKSCGGFERVTGGAGQAAWSPPHTDIPPGLKFRLNETAASKEDAGAEDYASLDNRVKPPSSLALGIDVPEMLPRLLDEVANLPGASDLAICHSGKPPRCRKSAMTNQIAATMGNPSVDQMLEHNRVYAKNHQPSPYIQEMPNGLKPTAIIKTMEIRNGGGRVHGMLEYIVALDTLFEVQDIMIIHHSDCGATHLDKESLHQRVLALDGATQEDVENLWSPDYKDLKDSLHEDVALIREYRFIRPELKARTRGYKYDIKTGILSLVAS
ncbi:hypothetical protein NQ176_g865 [Zarea fungicola]|uniref:Uncharacterized protein n=1 Tax=Zarea fungicola TaxID=93591 RepID=A0ACC1NVN9_9HYPO|nr:hypothetical protein NQ176_g865 [Lecanicillium fungicola]